MAWPALGLAGVALAAAAGAGLLRSWRAFALALGVATVLLRLAVPAILAGPPPDSGPLPADERAWIAEVLTTGAPKAGIARGTLLLRPDPADDRWALAAAARLARLRLAAALPRAGARATSSR